MVLQILQTLSYFGKFCFVILWETSGSRHFQNKRIIIYCVYNYRGYTMLKIYMYDIRCLSWQWQLNTLLRLELNFRGKLIISAPDSILIDLWTNLIALPRLSPCSCVILGNAVRKQYTRISRAIQHRETKRERERERTKKRGHLIWNTLIPGNRGTILDRYLYISVTLSIISSPVRFRWTVSHK